MAQDASTLDWSRCCAHSLNCIWRQHRTILPTLAWSAFSNKSRSRAHRAISSACLHFLLLSCPVCVILIFHLERATKCLCTACLWFSIILSHSSKRSSCQLLQMCAATVSNAFVGRCSMHILSQQFNQN